MSEPLTRQERAHRTALELEESADGSRLPVYLPSSRVLGATLGVDDPRLVTGAVETLTAQGVILAAESADQRRLVIPRANRELAPAPPVAPAVRQVADELGRRLDAAEVPVHLPSAAVLTVVLGASDPQLVNHAEQILAGAGTLRVVRDPQGEHGRGFQVVPRSLRDETAARRPSWLMVLAEMRAAIEDERSPLTADVDTLAAQYGVDEQDARLIVELLRDSGHVRTGFGRHAVPNWREGDLARPADDLEAAIGVVAAHSPTDSRLPGLSDLAQFVDLPRDAVLDVVRRHPDVISRGESVIVRHPGEDELVTPPPNQPVLDPDVEAVKAHVLAQLATHDPGKPLAGQRKLAQELGVSEYAVRRAMGELQLGGWVHHRTPGSRHLYAGGREGDSVAESPAPPTAPRTRGTRAQMEEVRESARVEVMRRLAELGPNTLVPGAQVFATELGLPVKTVRDTLQGLAQQGQIHHRTEGSKHFYTGPRPSDEELARLAEAAKAARRSPGPRRRQTPPA